MRETPTKPYFIRALHEWCTDNGYTPHITVQVEEHTRVPPGHVHDGQITLNIGTLATNKLVLGNEFIEFQARFGGIAEFVSIPVCAVSAIYARETGAGMGFEVTPYEPLAEPPATESIEPEKKPAASAQAPAKSSDEDPKPKQPRLTIVK